MRALALEGARECEWVWVWCVEKENAEMLSQRELAREVIQDEPSLSMDPFIPATLTFSLPTCRRLVTLKYPRANAFRYRLVK